MNTQQYDTYINVADWLAERDLPVAITLTETLEPSGGPESIIFPPTYARKGGDHPYAISTLRSDLPPEQAEAAGVIANLCDLDSVGSQANRMEPAFAQPPLNSLVPQILIKAGELAVNLLQLGHRIADGAVRFSALGQKVTEAMSALVRKRSAAELARLAPTSLVFGFWNSREKDDPKLAIKFPRILSSTIRATNVAVLKRSAQFNPAFDPTQLGLTDEPGAPAAEQDEKDPLSQLGLRAAPAVDTHGGVRVFGDIVRKTEINLVVIRSLAATGDSGSDAEATLRPDSHQAQRATAGGDSGLNTEATLKLRRYLLGLSLVAGRVQSAYNLRQGCLLVAKPGAKLQAQLVFPDGRREPFTWDVAAAYEFAKQAAKDFGVFAEKPTPQEHNLNPDEVKKALKEKAEDKEQKKSAKKAAKSASA